MSGRGSICGAYEGFSYNTEFLSLKLWRQQHNSTLFSRSRHPEVKWAQREDKVYLTVQLPDAKNVKVNVDPEGIFTFSASAGAENHVYELKLDLFDKVNVEESKINIGVRNIFCVVEKAEKKWWKKLLRGDAKPPHYVKVDWDKWVDEDDESGGPPDFDMGGMDFSKFGDMGGMEGLGGMGGMGSLGGMGGLGGLGGMGGMGGDDFEDTDDEDEDAKPEDQETENEIVSKLKEQKNEKAAAPGETEATPSA
ncbi:hypothetical protein Ancab_019552 [Ancistrocladus abbreviatus]